MRSKFPLLYTLLPLLAACGDDTSEAYIDPDDIEQEEIDITFTPQMADSIWNLYLDESHYTPKPETIPTDTLSSDFENYVENWLGDEETRDIVITFNGDKATVDWKEEGKKTKEAVKISIEGAHVVVRNERITGGELDGRARMNYILRGKSDNGSFRIYSNKKFMVTLDGISLTNAEGSAINAQKSTEKKRMFINVKKGTINHLCDAAVYTDTIAGEDEKGALFSEGKMILCGEGELHVTGNRTHAIAADDLIRIHSGVSIVVDSAYKDGIHTKDALHITNSRIKVFAGKDAIQTSADNANKGMEMQNGLLHLCAKRAITTQKLNLIDSHFCLVSKDEFLLPDPASFTQKQEPGYYIVYSAN